MGLLVGLPLKLLHIVFLLLRFAWPLLLAALIFWLVRRKKGGSRPVHRRRAAISPCATGFSVGCPWAFWWWKRRKRAAH